MTDDLDKLRAAALVDQARNPQSQDDALIVAFIKAYDAWRTSETVSMRAERFRLMEAARTNIASAPAVTDDDALIARRPPQNALSTAFVEKWMDAAADRIEALTKQPAMEQLAALMMALEIPPAAATLAPAQLGAIGAAIAKQAKAATKAEAERDALRLRVNSLIGLCKSYSGALLDSDYPPAERDKLDALIGDIEKPPSAKENADG